MVDRLRERGIDASLARPNTEQFGIDIRLTHGRVARWDSDGAAGLEALVLQDGDLVGFVPEIEGSEDFDDDQVIDAIARADYDKPVGELRDKAPAAAPPLPPAGGVFRRFLDGFRYR